MEFCDHHFDVLLAGAGEKKFFGLRIAGKTQGGIFLENFMDGDAEFIFVRAGFRLDGESNGGLGNLRGAVKNRGAFVAEGVAGHGLPELGDGTDVAGVQFANFGERFSLDDLDVLHALLSAAGKIRDGRIIFQDAAFYLEVVDASGENVGHGFEDEDR